ncbi:flagellar protein FlaG [Methylocaldum szegediense]|uniref:Flagellar protein FlaG n=1 Tax=Methylocaldum szegediense TaxID=73780 RepID=A0ABM9I852_9GAMM|nr:flagellar protein FlaG [Methylocaldum szegediense]CAI8952177.1 flagellar protein FlaG [Methylocaldum szegediense]
MINGVTSSIKPQAPPAFANESAKPVPANESAVVQNVARTVTSGAQTSSLERDAADQNVSPEELKRVVVHANAFIQLVQRNLEFSVDQDTQTMVMKVVDRDSGEVVRQIPPEEVLSMLKQLNEVGSKIGFLFKNSA